MCLGIVLDYNRAKGFGFVAPDEENANDLFVHHSNIDSVPRYLVPGQRVSFELGIFRNKPVALHVVVESSDEGADHDCSKHL